MTVKRRRRRVDRPVLALTVAYDGARLRRLRAAAGPATVQGELEEALSVALRREVDDGRRRAHRRGRARARAGRELRA